MKKSFLQSLLGWMCCRANPPLMGISVVRKKRFLTNVMEDKFQLLITDGMSSISKERQDVVCCRRINR